MSISGSRIAHFPPRVGERSELRQVVVLDGELDYANVERLRAALLAAAGPNLIVDMTDVRFVDAAALGAFAALAARIVPHRAVLVGLQPRLRRLFAIVKLDRHFWFAEDWTSVRGPRGRLRPLPARRLPARRGSLTFRADPPKNSR